MKHNKRLFVTICVMLITCFTLQITISTKSGIVSIAQAATKVSLNIKKATLYNGETIQLTLKGTTEKPYWKSSNEKIATVSKKGKVTAKRVGKTTVTANVGKKKYNCIITVKSSITVDVRRLSVEVGGWDYIKVKDHLKKSKYITFENSDKKIVKAGWSNSRKDEIKITGVASGKATITIKNKKTKDEAKVEVTVKVSTPIPTPTLEPTPEPIPTNTPEPTAKPRPKIIPNYLVKTEDIQVYFSGEYIDDTTLGSDVKTKQLHLETVIENNGNSPISIYAKDVYINGWAVFGQWQYTSFRCIESGKKAKLYLYCNLANANLDTFEDVNQLELKVRVENYEDSTLILETDSLLFEVRR